MFGTRDGEFPRDIDPVGVNVSDIMLDHLTPMELYTLRGRIDAVLPTASMAELNLEEETVRQYQTVKALQANVLGGNDEPNKKASVVQACATALQMLAKMQGDVHTSERFKRIENLMIKYLKLLPVETAEAFIDQYGRLILDLESQKK